MSNTVDLTLQNAAFGGDMVGRLPDGRAVATTLQGRAADGSLELDGRLLPGQTADDMLRELREVEPIVADTFREADEVMKPLLGRPLSEIIFVDPNDEDAIAAADDALRQTAITQPAVLATDLAKRSLAEYSPARRSPRVAAAVPRCLCSSCRSRPSRRSRACGGR